MMLLNSLSNLELHSIQAERVSYLNRPALRLMKPDMESEEQRIAILSDLTFKKGTPETEAYFFEVLVKPLEGG
jgi:hypothetical protein